MRHTRELRFMLDDRMIDTPLSHGLSFLRIFKTSPLFFCFFSPSPPLRHAHANTSLRTR